MDYSIRKYKRQVLLLIIITAFVIIMVVSMLSNTLSVKNVVSKAYRLPGKLSGLPNKSIPFFAVICKGFNDKKTSEQLNRTRIMLKTAAALTKVTVRFTIFSDFESIFEDIVSSMKSWPIEYQHRLQVDFHPVKYPDRYSSMRNAFKPCATYRLLLPEIMQHIDAAVYIDTDTIFLKAPEELLEEFKKMNSEQAAGFTIVPTARGEAMKKRLTFVSSHRCVNSGVGLMNFTRLRTAPGGGFTKITIKLYEKFEENITLHDQDALNLFLYRYPEFHYELSCSWNFQAYNGKATKDFNCRDAEKYGASLVHGAGCSFTNEETLQFLFNAWEKYELGTSISDLITNIEEDIAKHQSTVPRFWFKQHNASFTYTQMLKGI